MQVALILLLGLTAVLAVPPGRPRGKRWVNNYDGKLFFQCPDKQSINFIRSVHNDHFEDRVWDFSCQNTFSAPATCTWTNYVNNFDEDMIFTCSPSLVLSGMESYHDNHSEDRRWKFLCCQGEFHASHNCRWSDPANEFDSNLKWDAPLNHYLVGARSNHDNHKEDRRWSYQSCERS